MGATELLGHSLLPGRQSSPWKGQRLHTVGAPLLSPHVGWGWGSHSESGPAGSLSDKLQLLSTGRGVLSNAVCAS